MSVEAAINSLDRLYQRRHGECIEQFALWCYATNQHSRIAVWTTQPASVRRLKHQPSHIVFLLQFEEIGLGHGFPVSLRLKLCPPFICEGREHRDGTAVFVPVRQPAALC